MGIRMPTLCEICLAELERRYQFCDEVALEISCAKHICSVRINTVIRSRLLFIALLARVVGGATDDCSMTARFVFKAS